MAGKSDPTLSQQESIENFVLIFVQSVSGRFAGVGNLIFLWMGSIG
jgi:hypothetical protein